MEQLRCIKKSLTNTQGNCCSRSRWTFRGILLSCLFFLFTGIHAQTFTVNNWYAVASSTITPVDDCGTFYKFVIQCNNWSPCQFQILKDGVALGTDDITSSDANFYYESGDNQPAWRIMKDNSTGSWTYTFYLDMRSTPYKVTSSLPTEDYFVAKATPTKTVLTSADETFTLEGLSCSSVDTAVATYKWMKASDINLTSTSEVGTDANYTSTLDIDSVYYVLYADFTYDTLSVEAVSEPVLVTFKRPACSFSISLDNGKKFNETEYELSSGLSISSITTSAPDFVGAVNYCLQYKSLESDNAEWRDTLCSSSSSWSNFQPSVTALYRVKATGISSYSSLNTTVISSNEVLVRVSHECADGCDQEILWLDDFGSFSNAYTYTIKDVSGTSNTYESNLTDASGNTYSIENYWAPDINNFVKGHSYGLLNPLVINPTRDWCGKYRLDDGYYAIVKSPYDADGPNTGGGQDYWKGTDHTNGDTNGGMLFVNCNTGLVGSLIYERTAKLEGNCQNVEMIFSCYINNAVYKNQSNTPVNVRLEVLDPDSNIVHSVSSGDIQRRDYVELGTSQLPVDSWAHLSFKFSAADSFYTVRLYNNAAGGTENWGNDILLDDISISICYPNIQLISDSSSISPDSDNVVRTCLGTDVHLIAYNEVGMQNFITEPKYQFQYKNNTTVGLWKNYGGIITSPDTLITSSEDNRLFVGTTRFRVIAASSDDVINRYVAGEDVTLSCSDMYAVDSSLVVIITEPFELTLNVSGRTTVCEDEEVSLQLTADVSPNTASPVKFYWLQDGVDIAETAENTYFVSVSEPRTYTFAVKAVDDACQTDTARPWAASNTKTTDPIAILSRVALNLTVNKSVVQLGDSVALTVAPSTYTGGYNWYDENQKLLYTTATSTWVSYPTVNGTYTYYAEPSAASALCVDPSNEVSVQVEVSIPNIITPFNDGNGKERNNCFMCSEGGNSGFHVEIYNRYQQMIYEGDNGWDGTYRGKLAEPGTYYYRLFLKNGSVMKGTLEVAKF